MKREDQELVPAGRPSCYRLGPAGDPAEPQRTLLLTGVARSGTSFAGAVAGALGVPFGRHERDKVSGHWEHVALRAALDDFRALPVEAFLDKYEG